MKKQNVIISIILFLILFTSCSSKSPDKIPSGEWNYSLKINGATIGKAVISNNFKDGLYISTNTMYIDAGYIKNKSVQISTETADFKPVKLEIHNTINNTRTGKIENIDKIVKFNGPMVNLKSGNYASQIKIKQPYFLDGNYFLNELILKRFKPGTKVKAKIYEPSVEIDDTILVIVEVVGKEKIEVNGKEMNLIHVKQKVEQLKYIDMYLNDNGIIEKVVIKMLNNIFELSRK